MQDEGFIYRTEFYDFHYFFKPLFYYFLRFQGNRTGQIPSVKITMQNQHVLTLLLLGAKVSGACQPKHS